MYPRQYDGAYERFNDPLDREILAWEFDAVLKQAGLMKPGDVDAYGEAVWERLKHGE